MSPNSDDSPIPMYFFLGFTVRPAQDGPDATSHRSEAKLAAVMQIPAPRSGSALSEVKELLILKFFERTRREECADVKEWPIDISWDLRKESGVWLAGLDSLPTELRTELDV